MQIPQYEFESSFTPAKFAKPISALIIDDDPSFRKLMTAAANPEKLQIDAYASLADMGSFALIGKYDIAILDYYLPIMSGIEIAEYVDVFFATMPVVLVSAGRPDDLVNRPLPTCVRRFVCKSSGVKSILQIAHDLAGTFPPALACGYSS